MLESAAPSRRYRQSRTAGCRFNLYYSYRVSRPIGPNLRRKLEGRRTDDFPAVPAPHFVGFGAIGGPGRPRQLFLEKAAGSGRRIQEQHAPCFSAGVLPGVWDAAWQKRAGPRPANRDLISDLKGDFAAQYVGHLVAVAVEMECRLGAGRGSFFEQHDAVTGMAAEQLERG